MENTITEIGNDDEILNLLTDKVIDSSPGLAQLRQKLGGKAQKEPKFRFYSLYGHICHIETLRTAWYLIRENGQTPGIDGLTYDDIDKIEGIEDKTVLAILKKEKVEAYLKGVQEELKSRTYKAMPIRRVYIPKPDGRKRPLGIPTIKDRLIQMATLLIIEPIFEKDFLDCSYGFRPNRSAHDAIQEITKNLKAGRTAIFDADLKGYFDSIPHEQLMKCVKMRIIDGAVLKLIESWLKAPIVEKEKDDNGKWNIKVTKPEKGTAQGGVISPILANVYLHWFDKQFHAKNGPSQFAKARLVRYADDFVIMAKYMGDKILASIKYLIEEWLKLEINREKTRVITLKEIGDSIDFLGYTFRIEESLYGNQNFIKVEPRKKSIEKAMDKIRELTSRSRTYLPIDQFIGKVNSFLNGWSAYFKQGHPQRVFRKMDHYVELKIIKHLEKRSQRGYKKPKNQSWYYHLRRLGLVRLSGKQRIKTGK